MSRKTKILFAATTLLLLVSAFWFFSRPAPEPSYNGKTISQWLELYSNPQPPGSINRTIAQTNRNLARDAITHIGTNAIPVLLKKLNTQDSAIKKFILAHSSPESVARIGISTETYGRYTLSTARESERARSGFEILGPTAESAVPDLMKISAEPKNNWAPHTTIESLGFIGPAARPALPQLVNTLASSPTLFEQNNIADVILRIAFDSTTSKLRPECIPLLVPRLTENLKNPKLNALAIIRLLSDIGPDAAPAIPAIMPFVKSTDLTTSYAAALALQKIDPTNFPPK